MTALVALLVGGAVFVWIARAPRLGTRRLPSGPLLVVPAVAGGAILVATLSGTTAVLAMIAMGTGLGLLRVLLVGRADRDADALAEAVLHVCDGMAAELRAGQPPQSTLEHAADRWVMMAPVAAAGRLGADVPGAMRTLAQRRGAAELHRVAAAWQVSYASGAALASSLTLTAQALRERRATARLVSAELSAARATAHLMLVLPGIVLLLGSGIGGDPLGFLLHTPVGLGCLAAGLSLGFAGLFWLHRIASKVLGR